MNAHQVTQQFESELCQYTGARFAVAVNSCSMALLLAVAFHLQQRREKTVVDGSVGIPSRTYVSVPQAIIHAGGRPVYRDEQWSGAYQLRPYPIWDSARRFTSGMYQNFGRVLSQGDGERYIDTPGSGQFVCVSFHWSKILGLQQGGAVLHDDPAADAWLRRARFDGRREGVAPRDDQFDMVGWHCYLSPEVAALGLVRLSFLPQVNADLPNDDYPDLSRIEAFR